MPKVFISYRQTDDAQSLRVRIFAERLRGHDGIDVILDQFYLEALPGGPNDGWDKWSSDNALSAERVLIIGNSSWFECFEKKQPPGTGLGAASEADDLRHRIYKANGIVEDIRIVLFDVTDAKEIPAKLERYHRFRADRDFDAIIRWLGATVPVAAAGPQSADGRGGLRNAVRRKRLATAIGLTLALGFVVALYSVTWDRTELPWAEPTLVRLNVEGKIETQGPDHEFDRPRRLPDTVKLNPGETYRVTVTNPGCTDLQLGALLDSVDGRYEIKSLVLDNCASLTDRSAARLARCTHIQELRLAHCRSLTSEGIVQLADALPLKRLELCGIRQLDDTVLYRLSQRSAPRKTLESIGVGETRVTPEGARRVIEEFDIKVRR